MKLFFSGCQKFRRFVSSGINFSPQKLPFRATMLPEVLQFHRKFNYSTTAVTVVFYFQALAALSFTVGFFARTSAFVSMVMLHSMEGQLLAFPAGGHLFPTITTVLLCWLCLLPCELVFPRFVNFETKGFQSVTILLPLDSERN